VADGSGRLRDRAADAAIDRQLDDEMDDLHVTLTAEIIAGGTVLPVAIELAMIGRFYERSAITPSTCARVRTSTLTDRAAADVPMSEH